MHTLSTVCRHSLFFCRPLRVCLLGEAERSLTAAFQHLICVARARLVNRTPSLVSCGSFTLFILMPVQSTSFVCCCPTNGTTLIVALHFFQTFYSASFQTGWYNRDQTNSLCKRVRYIWLVTCYFYPGARQLPQGASSCPSLAFFLCCLIPNYIPFLSLSMWRRQQFEENKYFFSKRIHPQQVLERYTRSCQNLPGFGLTTETGEKHTGSFRFLYKDCGNSQTLIPHLHSSLNWKGVEKHICYLSAVAGQVS